MDATAPAIDSPPPAETTRIVLVGAGHAHLQIVHWWRRRPIPNAELILLSAFDQATYSGMLPGALAGAYSPDALLIDLARLTERSNVQLVVDRGVALDPIAQQIECAHQPSVAYDIVSINIGSVPQAESLWQTHRMIVGVKPLATFPDRFQRRLTEWQTQAAAAQSDEPLRLCVVGGGAAGVELALCLWSGLRGRGIAADVSICEGGSQLLAGAGTAARRKVLREIGRRGMRVLLGRRVVGCDESGPPAVVLDDGEHLPCDLAIWATGAAPPAVVSRFGLPLSTRGFLATKRTLQSTGFKNVFVVGDTADLIEAPAPKAGVYAVRQGPVLFENLRRLVSDAPLQAYIPQQGFLSLLACGDGTAILDFHGWSSHSRWAWWLKRRIDFAFVRQFQE